MILNITMKTPDALETAIENVLCDKEYSEDPDLEAEARDEEAYELKELAGKWFAYGESVTIEIDTEANTATVLETSVRKEDDE